MFGDEKDSFYSHRLSHVFPIHMTNLNESERNNTSRRAVS
jgi:hypothetical protein